jgi:F-type H+-transporting ATPase subunit gamma
MKALAASRIGQYEKSVQSLGDYYRTVELGLSAYFRENSEAPIKINQKKGSNGQSRPIGVIVFGSDQGLVGQFNEVISEYAIKTLAHLPGKPHVWAVGARVHARLLDSGLEVVGQFTVPNSVEAIAPLVSEIQIASETHGSKEPHPQVIVFHNRPKSGSLYEPVSQQLLPLDEKWRDHLSKIPWPTSKLPEVMNKDGSALKGLIREYLFISVFRACAESLTSENASRLAAMERADKNIEELMTNLNNMFHRLRQESIDEELFDVISGFEALTKFERYLPK